jgi:putative ABC transport system ATP-binding protein
LEVINQVGEVFRLDRVSLRRGQLDVLDEVSAVIGGGACTAVVGRSGAGKSSLLRLLTRLEEPDAGSITFQGTALAAMPVLALRRRVQLLAQQPVLLTTDRVASELRVALPGLSERAVCGLLRRVGLPGSFAGRSVDGLSGGQQQRVCLARALAVEPDVLLLDEPTAALDADSAQVIEDLVTAMVGQGRSVVLICHDPAQVQRLADTIIVLRDGRVTATGPPEEVGHLRHVGRDGDHE